MPSDKSFTNVPDLQIGSTIAQYYTNLVEDILERTELRKSILNDIILLIVKSFLMMFKLINSEESFIEKNDCKEYTKTYVLTIFYLTALVI